MRQRPMAGGSSIDLSTLKPLSTAEEPSGPPHLSRRHPPGGPSSIDLSALEPLEAAAKPRTPRTYAAAMFAAQASGLQAAHVTAGPTSPQAALVSWVETSDAAGCPARVTARKEVETGRGHFFGQPAWPSRDNQFPQPFHGRAQSEYGLMQQQGGKWFEGSGQDVCNNARPRDSGRHVPGSAAAAALTPGRTRPSSAHQQTFAGDQVRTLIGGT